MWAVVVAAVEVASEAVGQRLRCCRLQAQPCFICCNGASQIALILPCQPKLKPAVRIARVPLRQDLIACYCLSKPAVTTQPIANLQ